VRGVEREGDFWVEFPPAAARVHPAPQAVRLFPLGIRREEVRGEDAKNGDE